MTWLASSAVLQLTGGSEILSIMTYHSMAARLGFACVAKAACHNKLAKNIPRTIAQQISHIIRKLSVKCDLANVQYLEFHMQHPTITGTQQARGCLSNAIKPAT